LISDVTDNSTHALFACLSKNKKYSGFQVPCCVCSGIAPCLFSAFPVVPYRKASAEVSIVLVLVNSRFLSARVLALLFPFESHALSYNTILTFSSGIVPKYAGAQLVFSSYYH
jgi:hypothetical protein